MQTLSEKEVGKLPQLTPGGQNNIDTKTKSEKGIYRPNPLMKQN